MEQFDRNLLMGTINAALIVIHWGLIDDNISQRMI